MQDHIVAHAAAAALSLSWIASSKRLAESATRRPVTSATAAVASTHTRASRPDAGRGADADAERPRPLTSYIAIKPGSPAEVRRDFLHPRPVPVVPISAHRHTHPQALYQPATTWAPIDALHLHASMWTGDVVPALDCHLLPLAGTRRVPTASPSACKDSAPVLVLSPLASTSATLAAAAASQFSQENVRSEHIDDVHFHSPWAIGGVSRLQCYIHALTSSVLTAQATMRQLFKEIDSHSLSADTLIAETDQQILHAHRVESGDTSMVCGFARAHLSADSHSNTLCRRPYTPLISSRCVASDQTMRMPFLQKKAG
jgi:hypothetical protein